MAYNQILIKNLKIKFATVIEYSMLPQQLRKRQLVLNAV